MSNIAKVKKIAKAINALAKNDSVQVSVGGDTAYSTGGSINIPIGDFSDPRFMKMVQGYIDHEIGHESETEHGYMAKAISIGGNLMGSILNALEDARMENSRGNIYPGARINLEVLFSIAIEDEIIPNPNDMKQNIMEVIFSYILHASRELVCGYTATHASLALSIIRQSAGDVFADGLVELLKESPSMKTTYCAFQLAEKIYNYLDQSVNNPPPKQQPQPGQSQDSDDADSGSSSDSNDDDDSQGQSDSNDDDDSQGQSDSNDDDGSQGQSGSNDDDGSQGQSESNDDDGSSSEGSADSSSPDGNDESSSSPNSGLQGVKADLDTLHDYHEEVQDCITDKARNYDDVDTAELQCLRIDKASNATMVSFDLAGWRSLSSKFARTLQKVIIDKTETLKMASSTGRRIMRSKLASSQLGNDDVFEYREETEALDSSVMLLVDASGSMGFDNMREANKTALGFAKGFQRMGIDIEVNYYGVYNQIASRNEIYTAKEFGKKLDVSKFSVASSGTTPTEEALFYALVRMSNQTQQNKIIFLITDGQPDCGNSVQMVHEKLVNAGVKVIPIGLGTKSVQGFKNSVYAANSEEVNNALKNAIKKKLF
ncbi:VWA domain-containing protein [uncultured Alteromonas sp.]|uniref:vWA domain-containing protein n=1 Tax=uncultured Alteromonas sp. TaxID=179113 RepID=UPI00267DAE87